jgi:diaminopimelate decarboxylase
LQRRCTRNAIVEVAHSMADVLFISGLYSGPSPSAGLGVARSLRAAFPGARLVGVDYWAGSTGFHDGVFDRIWLKPSWDLIEQDLYAKEIEGALAQGAFWIPTLDLEVAWLARMLKPMRGLLAPHAAALAPTRKPKPGVAEMLPFGLPPTLDLAASDDEIHAFCRAHSWRVWVKGPYHEAVAATSWRRLEEIRKQMAERWENGPLSLQAHIRGYEESIAFAAVDGRLADAVYMKKRIVTPEGKTWAGRVGEVPADLLAAVEGAVASLHWTGGAEIELLRDVDGRLWLLEWNPRFPAWVNGAALAGRNLAAALVKAALGLGSTRRPAMDESEFARVVVEVPVRSDLPLPLPGEPDHGALAAAGKYGAGLSAILPMLAATAPVEAPPSAPPALSSETAADLRALDAAAPTPRRMLLPATARAAFAQLDSGRLIDGTALHFAYSVKTSPDVEYLALARKSGMLAECISQLELRRALEQGWRADEIILNGPGKWWPETAPAIDGLRAVFCDSVEELERLAASPRNDRLWGVRLRIPGFDSRFGIALDAPDSFERLCAAVAALPKTRAFGIHVHMASSLVGIGHWRDVVESAIVWARMIEAATARPVRALDLGGGYHPEDLPHLPFAEITAFARANLPALREVYVEPGRALTQSTMAILTRVLDVRRSAGKLDEVVVDACIAELPLAAVNPHRVFRLTEDGAVAVSRGSVRVLGRICMEDDVISSGLDLPESLAVGDRLVICDAGAYERTMSYEFGRAGYN